MGRLMDGCVRGWVGGEASIPSFPERFSGPILPSCTLKIHVFLDVKEGQ